ncbi:MAG: hypothetical protein WCV81_03630 [Microgenomates group bacterium]|jgi:hypothetical protein
MAIDTEPKEFIYNRTGNLSQTTALNTALAERFMREADIRRNILIVDSDKKPDGQSVSVGDDILAWRSIAPLTELTKIILKPKRLHAIEVVGNQYKVLIHDKIIDDDIKTKGYKDRAEYEERYAATLNHEVRSAASEILFREKLGWHEQKHNYIVYMFPASFILTDLLLADFQGVLFQLGIVTCITNPLINMLQNSFYQQRRKFNELGASFLNDFDIPIPPDLNYKPWYKAFYPVLPVDKWIKGKKVLASKENLIVERGSLA